MEATWTSTPYGGRRDVSMQTIARLVEVVRVQSERTRNRRADRIGEILSPWGNIARTATLALAITPTLALATMLAPIFISVPLALRDHRFKSGKEVSKVE